MSEQIKIDRHNFLKQSVIGTAGIFIPLSFLEAQSQQQEKPAPLNLETVKEFVGVCHGNLIEQRKC